MPQRKLHCRRMGLLGTRSANLVNLVVNAGGEALGGHVQTLCHILVQKVLQRVFLKVWLPPLLNELAFW